MDFGYSVCHKGRQVREVLEASSGIGKRLMTALGHSGRSESTVLLEVQEALDAATVIEDQAEAKVHAELSRPGFTIFTDGSRA
jgi:hypothetical protein